MLHYITLQLPNTTEHNDTITEQYTTIPNFANTKQYHSEPYNYNAILNLTMHYYTSASPQNTSL